MGTRGLLAVCITAIGLTGRAMAGVAPDPTPAGPYALRVGEYKLPAARDPFVAPLVKTELWARVYLPAEQVARPHPLIVFLHGNHATCGHTVDGVAGRVDDDITYTTTGMCPPGYVVVPSHAGYQYMATTLASWGYAVVSINANRGVNAANGAPGDDGLNIRRGRLVLRHLLQLARWNRSGGAPASLGFSLRGQLDFDQIGLVGHSRGGEGMLAAAQIYRDAGSIWPELFLSAPAGRQEPRFRAIFEIAPVDGQTSRVFSANNVPWSVLLPACDGDVSDLEGMRVFDRAVAGRAETDPSPKSVFTVWGANHNFYNSEWQQSDSVGCAGDGNVPLFDAAAAGSAAQQATGLYPVMGLFRSVLGAGAVAPFGNLLDPAFDPPAGLAAITPLQRSYVDNAAAAGSLVVDDFLRPAGTGVSGAGNFASNLDGFSQGTLTEHDPVLQVGNVTWSRPEGVPPAGIFLQSNITRPGAGKPIGGYGTLEFRAGLSCDAADFGGCTAPSPLNARGTTDFSVALVLADGRLSPAVPVSRYAALIGPAGLVPFLSTPAVARNAMTPQIGIDPVPFALLHPVLQSLRIPLGDFGVAAGTLVRGVRFTFDRVDQGAVTLANVRFARVLPRSPDGGGPGPIPFARRDAEIVPPAGPPRQAARLVAVRRAVEQEAPAPAPAVVEIEVAAPRGFQVKDALPALELGGTRLTRSRFSGTGPGRHLVFIVDSARFAALPAGAEGVVRNGAEAWRLTVK